MCGCRDLNVRDQKKEVKREGRKVQDLWVRCLGDRQVKASIKKLSAEAMFGKKVGLFGGAFYPAKSLPGALPLRQRGNRTFPNIIFQISNFLATHRQLPPTPASASLFAKLLRLCLGLCSIRLRLRSYAPISSFTRAYSYPSYRPTPAT
jgi:hypothetical protein